MKNKSVKSKNPIESSQIDVFNKYKNRKTAVGIGIVGVILVAIFFKGVFVAASVNGKPISRWSLIQRLEQQGGKNVLDSMITEELIANEAKRKRLVVSEDEINQQIKTIEASVAKQGTTLKQALERQGMTEADLRKDLQSQKIVEKLVAGKVKVTDAEVDKYITDSKTPIEEGEESATKIQVAEQLKQQKFQEEAQLLIASLKKVAKIEYYATY